MSHQPDHQIVFVCQHGAFRSRIAAAFFNASAPVAWSAISAGVTPQTEVSERLAPLMAGTGAEDFIDVAPPRALADSPTARTIAIDVEVPGAELWRLTPDPPPTDDLLRDEIRARVSSLVAELAGTPVL